MDQKRSRRDEQPDRSSDMEQAEGSRETARANESFRNRESGRDLGSSSDRAMFSDELPSNDAEAPDENRKSGDSGGGAGHSERGRSNTGGITNRELDREMSEQDELPERGRSQSER